MKSLQNWTRRIQGQTDHHSKKLVNLENHVERLEERLSKIEDFDPAPKDFDLEERPPHIMTPPCRVSFPRPRWGSSWTTHGASIVKEAGPGRAVVYRGIKLVNGGVAREDTLWRWRLVTEAPEGKAWWRRWDISRRTFFGIRHLTSGDRYPDGRPYGSAPPEKKNPLFIEAILHFYYATQPWMDGRSHSGMAVIRQLRAEGLIEARDPGEIEHPLRAYKLTSRGEAYVEALRRTPLPEQE